jgi:hypothetical protein
MLSVGVGGRMSTRGPPTGLPSANDLLSGLAGLRRTAGTDGAAGSGVPAAKQARDLAGARPAGGVEISLEMLTSVKLKAASKADVVNDKITPVEGTPEVVRMRSRLKRVERPATPLGSPPAHRTGAGAASHALKAPAASTLLDKAAITASPRQDKLRKARVLSPLGHGQGNARSGSGARGSIRGYKGSTLSSKTGGVPPSLAPLNASRKAEQGEPALVPSTAQESSQKKGSIWSMIVNPRSLWG